MCEEECEHRRLIVDAYDVTAVITKSGSAHLRHEPQMTDFPDEWMRCLNCDEEDLDVAVTLHPASYWVAEIRNEPKELLQCSCGSSYWYLAFHYMEIYMRPDRLAEMTALGPVEGACCVNCGGCYVRNFHEIATSFYLHKP